MLWFTLSVSFCVAMRVSSFSLIYSFMVWLSFFCASISFVSMVLFSLEISFFIDSIWAVKSHVSIECVDNDLLCEGRVVSVGDMWGV